MPAPAPAPVADTLARPLRDLRISVTDRCNLRCAYCMPLEKYEWLARDRILSFEQITRLVRLFTRVGLERVRLTGGEPLLRSDLPDLVRMVVAVPGLTEVALTTNAVHLAAQVGALVDAGLRRVNVSLDTLERARFKALTQRDELPRTLAGIRAARDAGLRPVKVNMVVQRGFNEDEIVPMARFCRDEGLELRLIEYMDCGNQSGWDLSKVVTEREILARIGAVFPLRPAARARPSDPAERHEYADGAGRLGVVASVSRPFCGGCTRARLTAEGQLVTCLFAEGGVPLKPLLDREAPDVEILHRIGTTWAARADRHSEERLARILSDHGYSPDDRRKIEMIRLGG